MPHNVPDQTRGKTLLLITSGSAFFFLLKTLLVALIHQFTPLENWANYVIVTIIMLPGAWIFNSKISFRIPLSRKTFSRYIQQAAFFKILDNVLFNIFAYAAGFSPVMSVCLTTVVIFALRIIAYFKFVFLPD